MFVQTARTLQYAEDADSGGDSILVREFSSFVMRTVADIVDASLAMSPEPGVVNKFHLAVTNVSAHKGSPTSAFRGDSTVQKLCTVCHGLKSRCAVQLESVDDAMYNFAQRLTRSKSLFRATDNDKSGDISRSELYTALRRFKVWPRLLRPAVSSCTPFGSLLSLLHCSLTTGCRLLRDRARTDTCMPVCSAPGANHQEGVP